MTILETVDLQKVYTQGELHFAALNGVDLQFTAGKFYAIVGRSGSGKSTLLHLLGGLDRPSGGKILLEGRDLAAMSEKELALMRRRQLGFVFQAYNLLEEHTAEDNILAPLRLDRRAKDEAYFQAIIEHLEIGPLLKKYPQQLSGGEQQRCAIARALIMKPAILLADEPTGNLDTATSDKVIGLLRQIVDDFKQTLIMVTHDLGIAAKADVRIRLDSGRVLGVEGEGQD